MLIVRNTFRLRFGAAKEALALAKEGLAINEKAGFHGSRLLVDVVADFYTLVLEVPIENLSDFERRLRDTTQTKEWQAWYSGFCKFVESGKREVFRVVEP